jgi:hypothetical protein
MRKNVTREILRWRSEYILVVPFTSPETHIEIWESAGISTKPHSGKRLTGLSANGTEESDYVPSWRTNNLAATFSGENLLGAFSIHANESAE